jgi:hypothetical protein
MYPFIIFSKKRYVGNLYESDPTSYEQKSMGIALKRRDYAPIVKVIYGGAIRILLTEKSIVKAVKYVKEKLHDLVNGKFGMYHLTITKSLRAEYKKIVPPHKMLAERITKRDPGNAPASGERIGYVFISPPVGQEASKLQGERIETPIYIRENGLVPDYKYYIEHQIMNPITQLFALRVEELPGFTARKWSTDPRRAEVERLAVVEELIFKDALSQCDKATRQKFVTEKLGCKILATEGPRTRSRVAAAAPVAAKKQMSINSYFLDSLMVSKINERKKLGKTVAISNEE